MKPVRLSALILAIVALAGCAAADNAPKSEPSFYRDLAQPGAQLDAAAAASMISGYRANNGLPAVTLDPELTRLAEAQAAIMAKRDKLDHNAGKPFVARLKASGYDAKDGGREYRRRLSHAGRGVLRLARFPPHRANMLLKGATRIGIAAVYTPTSKYKVYWALILAEPDDKKPPPPPGCPVPWPPSVASNPPSPGR